MMPGMNLGLSLLLHVVGVVLWMGSLMAMSRALVLLAKRPGPGRPVLAELAGRLNIMALLGLGLTVGSGLYQLMLWPAGVFKNTRWMHHKLTAVIAVVVVHILTIRLQRKWRSLGENDALRPGPASALHGIAGLLLFAIVGLVYFSLPHFLHIPTM